MERSSSRNRIKVPDRLPQGPLITTEAPFWREMLGDYVRGAVESRTWNPAVKATSIEHTAVLQREEVVSEEVDTGSILSRAKDIFSAPKRRTKRALLAGAVAGAALLSGFSAQESRANEEPGTMSIVAQTAPTTSLAERRTPSDLLDLTKDRWMKVPISAEEAPPPPAMKAELKPKPKQEPRSQENKDHSVSRGASASLSVDFPSGLSNIQRIVYEVAKSCNNENQWDAIKNIVYHESYPKWDPASLNSTSGAGGLFQALPTSKYGVGDSWPTNPRAQAEWGVCVYMNKKNNPQGRYWDPNEAWRFWQANNWY